jgi:phytanoyl-CoA hydroxylase
MTKDQKLFFDEQGYLVVRGLFSPGEAASYRDHYMDLRAKAAYPGDSAGVDIGSDDPMKQYPRMIHMHRWDRRSLEWFLDPRIARTLSCLLDREAIATQTMIYFKPPKARGQALHQDQFYLRVQPGTCIAAWMALDPCSEENGCLRVVPGSHRWPLLCTIKADTSVSFTDVTVPIPDGTEVRSMVMEPGDVLFFNGQVVHGSGPNDSGVRFRRALIGHYVAGDAQKVAQFFHPALRMDGSVVELGVSEGGGACGVWVDGKGKSVIEMVGAGAEGPGGPAR